MTKCNVFTLTFFDLPDLLLEGRPKVAWYAFNWRRLNLRLNVSIFAAAPNAADALTAVLALSTNLSQVQASYLAGVPVVPIPLTISTAVWLFGRINSDV